MVAKRTTPTRLARMSTTAKMATYVQGHSATLMTWSCVHRTDLYERQWCIPNAFDRFCSSQGRRSQDEGRAHQPRGISTCLKTTSPVSRSALP